MLFSALPKWAGFVRAAGPLAVLTAACVSIAAAGGCNGTGSGDTGDRGKRPVPNELGNGQRVSEVIGPATWFNTPQCLLPPAENIALTGQVITAVDRFDETGTGQVGNIYLEDVPVDGADPVPFSGLEIFGAAFTPPDLRVFEGDVMDTFGSYAEFAGPSGAGKQFPSCATLPEASGTLTFRFDNGFHPPALIVPAGTDPARWNVVKGYSNARQWLGMLVKFENVTLPVSGSGSSGRFAINIDMGPGVSQTDIVSIDNELFDLKSLIPTVPTGGMTVKSVTGVLTYFYNFHISPRSAEDIEL